MLTSTILSICARKLCLQNLRLLCSTSYVPRGILNLKHQKNGSISIDVRGPVELQSISWGKWQIKITLDYKINENVCLFDSQE